MNGESATKSPDCEEQQRLKAEEVVTSRDNAKWVAGKTLEDERLKLSEELVELQDVQMNLEQFIAQNMEKNDRMERGMQMVAIERVKTLELPSRLQEEDRRCREAETA